MTDYKRDQLRGELNRSLQGRGLDTPIFKDIAASYMTFVDILRDLNRKIESLEGSDDEKDVRLYLAYIGEARRVEKAGRDILEFLGITGREKAEEEELRL